jgi:uncharacterized oxidoreductase
MHAGPADLAGLDRIRRPPRLYRIDNARKRMTAVVHTIRVDPLRAAMRLVVRGFGSAEAEVEAVADNLIEANLTGHDSHGIGMLPRYAQSFLEGGLKPNSHVSTLADSGVLLRLDGNAGFGQVVGHEAMALGI